MSDDLYGYSYEPPKSSGDYLKIKEKGEKVRIRLASKPFRFTSEFEDKKTGKSVVKENVAWVVLHKEVIGKEPVVTVKHFRAGMMIYGLIRDFAKDPDWGDPTLYDLEITRTEQDGKYYTVIAKPNCKPITDEQKKMIEEANYDLTALYIPKEKPFGVPDPTDDDDPFSSDD
jgi:hypothetical protein